MGDYWTIEIWRMRRWVKVRGVGVWVPFYIVRVVTPDGETFDEWEEILWEDALSRYNTLITH